MSETAAFTGTEETPGTIRSWAMAIRPPTLTAAVAPIAVGSGLAVADDVFVWGPALAALGGALAIQVGANLANDISDFRRGADTEQRIGPTRVTQTGLLSERGVVRGMWTAFALATLAGLYLTAVAGWPVVAVGVFSILAALIYTGGPWPVGYHGLGEVFTFVFFGVVAVVGTYFVQAEELTGPAFAIAVPVGLTVSAILAVNNVRDIETDRVADKRTLAVLLGRRGGRALFLVLLGGAYVWTVGLALSDAASAWALLPLLTLPLAVGPTLTVLRSVDGPSLNAALRATARLHLAFGLLLALGLAI